MTVIRGKARGGGAQGAIYLMSLRDNDVMPRLVEIRGTAAPGDVHKSLVEMSLTSELTKTDKGLWHLQINPAPGEDQAMTDDGWKQMADITERHLGLEGQKRVMVEHVKYGRRHIHIMWERYDHEKGKMIDIKYSRLKQRSAVREIELTMGLKITPMRNVREKDIKLALTGLWQETGGGARFIKEADELGYTITSGEGRRSYKVVDQTGRSFDLVRQLDGVRTKAVREGLKDQKLKTEKAAIRAIRVRQQKEALALKQEQMAHAKKKFQQEEAARAEQKQVFAEKLDLMKGAGPGMTERNDDAELTKKQDLAIEAIKKFKQEQARAEEKQRQYDALKSMKNMGLDFTAPAREDESGKGDQPEQPAPDMTQKSEPSPELAKDQPASPEPEKLETDRERRLREFREQMNPIREISPQPAKEQPPLRDDRPETDRERRLREFREEMERARDRERDRGHDFER